jgi:predicted acylesterase/phospholipase RssA
MRQRLAAVDWHDLFDDTPSHAETNFRERALEQNYYPGLEFGVTNEGIRAAHGVVGGQKIKLFFNTLVGADRGERKIENLAIPVAIVATDIGTGEKVVFRSGELSAAMRASMSVPALLAPVPYQGRYLVDGGLVDNLPIDEVMASCHPDVVIAVDVGSPLARPEDMTTVRAITGQTIGVLTEQNSERSRAMLKPGDIYIKPALAGITAADFNEFRAGAESGRQAALCADAGAIRRLGRQTQDGCAGKAARGRGADHGPEAGQSRLRGAPHPHPSGRPLRSRAAGTRPGTDLRRRRRRERRLQSRHRGRPHGAANRRHREKLGPELFALGRVHRSHRQGNAVRAARRLSPEMGQFAGRGMVDGLPGG